MDRDDETRIAGPLAPAAILVLTLLGCGGSELASGSRPNLLLITVDTLRADHLGCYGYEGAQTAALDALAQRGALFEQAYTPAPMTLPAHATLMTGLSPPQHGARVNGEHRLSEGIPTLAEELSAAGYRTGAFVAAFVLHARFGLARGFDEYDDDFSGAYEQEVPESLSLYRPGNLVVDAALAWLGTESSAPGSAENAPFFAWVHLYDVHYPWHDHDPDGSGASDGQGTYDGEIAFADQQVARLLEFLGQRGLDENTLVVVLADHGEGLGDHSETEHGYLLNEEVLHVPWIMAGPGVTPGLRVSALVTLEDFLPTVCELLDIGISSAISGRSLVPALRGEPIEAGVSYAETDLPWTGFRWAPQRSLTTERWKYIRTPQPELYDRSRDLAELENLVQIERDVYARLEAQLSALESQLGERESERATLSGVDLARLAELGYAAGDTDVEAPDDDAGLADVKQRLGAKDLAARLRRGLATESLEPEESLEMALELVLLSPETPAFHRQLGSAWVRMGRVDQGIVELTIALDMEPGSAGAHYELGDVLQQAGQSAEARPHFEIALELESEMAVAHVGLGNVERSAGRPDLAAARYTEALRLRPGYPEAYYNLAQTYVDRGKWNLAIQSLESALEHRPEWGLAHATLANLLAGRGRMDEAIEHYREALASQPEDADLLNDLGTALDAVGSGEEAREKFLAALDAQPGFYRPHINLANQVWKAGDYAAALREFEEALRLAPQLAEPTNRLARFLATCPDEALREGERAVALAERARDLTEARNARVLDTLAAAYAADGRYTDALATAHQAEQRAKLDGDELLAEAIVERLALYALGKPFVAARAAVEESEDGD